MLLPLLFLHLLFIPVSCQSAHDRANMDKLGELRARWNRLHPAKIHPISEEDKKILEAFEKERKDPDHVPSNLEMPDADKLIEGDIIPSDEDIAEIEKIVRAEERGEARHTRAISHTGARNWPVDKPIPYRIAEGFSDENVRMIHEEMQSFKENSCIEFTNSEDPESKGLVFQIGDRCYVLALGDIRERDIKDNKPAGVAQHETMHALGFGHTMTRQVFWKPDREQYMEFFSAALREGIEHNFIMLTDREADTYSLPYEYNSIMHYGAFAGSIDNKSLAVLMPKDRAYLQSVGLEGSPTFNDWKALNIRYDCINKMCSTLIVCQNNGFQHPRHCDRCMCPQFYQGTHCEEPVHPFDLAQAEEKTLRVVYDKPLNDNHQLDAPYSQSERELRVIMAPEGRTIRVTVNEIIPTTLVEHISCVHQCKYHGLEIVDGGDLTVVGKRFCCSNISFYETAHTFVSKTNIVGYRAYTKPGIGFLSDVTFSIEPIIEPSQVTSTPATDDFSSDANTTEEPEQPLVTAEPEPGVDEQTAGPYRTRLPFTTTPVVRSTTTTVPAVPEKSGIEKVMESIRSLLGQVSEKIDNLTALLGVW